MENKTIFIDTSGFYALFDKSDSNHLPISNFLKNSNEYFITSNYIVDELITLFRFRKIPLESFQEFIDSLISEKSCDILWIDKTAELKAWKLLKKYKDHHFSFTDCTSFVLMKELKISKACTIDEHFKIMGFETVV